MRRDARAKMVAGAAQLLGAGGVGATSVRELAKASGAPLGSTYHYFPGGKSQLIDEAVERVTLSVERLLTKASEGGAVAVLDAFVDNWRAFLIAADYQSSCPVLAVATENTTGSEAAAASFLRWQSILADVLKADGVEEERAFRLAWMVVASLEGAVVLARSQKSPAPLDAVAAEMGELIRSAIGPSDVQP